MDPSGSYFSWKASAMGKNVSNAKTFLEKRWQIKNFFKFCMLNVTGGTPVYIQIMHLFLFGCPYKVELASWVFFGRVIAPEV